MGKKAVHHKEPVFEAVLKRKLWNLAHGLYPTQLALRGQSRAHGTWFTSSTVVRRGGEGSVLVSCSPLLCFLLCLTAATRSGPENMENKLSPLAEDVSSLELAESP